MHAPVFKNDSFAGCEIASSRPWSCERRTLGRGSMTTSPVSWMNHYVIDPSYPMSKPGEVQLSISHSEGECVPVGISDRDRNS